MRLRFAALAAVALIASSQAHTQSSLGWLFSRCTDLDKSPDDRIKACLSILHSEGLEQDEFAFANVDLGRAYTAKSDDADALPAYTKAIELEPQLWQAYANRARLYLRRNDLDAALGDYDKLAAMDPLKLKLYREVSGIHYRTETTERTNMPTSDREVAQFNEDLAELKAALSRGLGQRCASLQKNHALPQAFADCDRSVSLDPKSARALGQRGFLEYEQGQYQKALDDFNAASEADPKSAPALFSLGIVKQKMGDAKGGDADIQAALALDPDIEKKFAASGLKR
jgi:tetratricopeptide (TPR) repeat protein